jgi:hypothetical protein
VGSYFVNPGMLLGAAAIAAPIIIFLLTRFRYRRVEFAALVFLQRALKKQQRRLRLENLLLLLIRILILLLLAVTLARPRAPRDVVLKEDQGPKNVVVVIDTSFSMGYQVGSDTVHERARRAAREIVGGLRDGDRVALVAFDDVARPLYARPRQLNERVKQEVLQDLEDAPEMALSQRGTDLGEVVHGLPRVLRAFDFDASGQPPPPDSPPAPKTVFLLTDAQRYGLLDASGGLLDRTLPGRADEIKEMGGHLVLVDCGAEEPKNLTVTRLASREPVVGMGLPCHVEASIQNTSSEEITDLTVEYYVDGAETPQRTVSLTIPPNEERSPDPLRYVFREAGTHTVEILVKSDPLVVDNRRQLVVDVRESVRVLLVDGERSGERWESETDFLFEVLALTPYPGEDGLGLLKPERIVEAELPSQRLSDFSVVLVANVVSLDDELTSALEEFARNGGAVIFSMGNLVDAQAYNEGLWRRGAGLFPVKLTGKQGGTRAEASTDEEALAWVMRLAEADEHPLRLFGEEEMATWLRMPSIFGLHTVDLAVPGAEAADQGVRVPLEVIPRPADDAPDAVADREALGQPLVVEKAFGRGRVMAWLSTCDYAWNNCVLYDGFYVPFWRQTVLDLAQRTRPPVNLQLGGRYERLLRQEEYAAQVEVLTPGGLRESVVLAKDEQESHYRLVYPADDERGGLQESGLYTVTRKGVAGATEPEPDHFAVLLDPAEGDLAKFTADELGQALGVELQPIRAEAAREVLQDKGGLGGTREYWREFLAVVIALLALESLLAALFGRRRR